MYDEAKADQVTHVSTPHSSCDRVGAWKENLHNFILRYIAKYFPYTIQVYFHSTSQM